MDQNMQIGGVNMPNIKSSKKDVIQSKIAYEKNKANKSALKTAIKKFDVAVAANDQAAAAAAHQAAVKAVDKAVTKGILHKNTAARKKSSMTLQLNKMA
jgi:small subunit ribosomal protein S20